MADPQSLQYRVVDVFTKQPLEGNSLAVFLDGSGLSGITMQKIARALNLSETVFVLPSTRADCVAAFRIFTPSREMPFAGHPTVGACFVLLNEKMLDPNTERFAVEEKVGAVPIRIEKNDGDLIWLSTPPIEFGPTYDRALCASVLGLSGSDLLDHEPQLVTAGNPTVFIPARDKATVDRAMLDGAGMAKLHGPYPSPFCVFVFTPVESGAYSRMFAPEYGIVEDPATGSSTGPLAAYMMRNGMISGTAGTRFISEQGTKMQRRSLLHVLVRGDQGSEGIDVGGYVTPVASAVMSLRME